MKNEFGFLCLSCEFKGDDFIRAVAEMGHRVYLITSEDKRDAPWSYDLITETFYMPEKDGRKWSLEDMELGVAHLMRGSKIDRIIALDDYDVHKAAHLREEFRMPGMGETTARHFYDKLAMRIQAKDAGIRVPGFCALFNDTDIHHYLNTSQGPWFVKPRSDAGTLGIRRVENEEAFWELSDSLGENRHHYLIEEFKVGDVCHVDSLSYDDEIAFTRSSQYLQPPFDIAHGGGIFQSCTLDIDDARHKQLSALNKEVLAAFGMKHGASHSEYIMHNGEPVFLETSARVGGANLSNMVHIASEVNLWREWAKIEDAVLQKASYTPPKSIPNHAGIIASLSRHDHPDYSQYSDPEIAWTLDKKYHVGFIFSDTGQDKVLDMLDKYSRIIAEDYHATVPLKE
jgi:biotin carboxylase